MDSICTQPQAKQRHAQGAGARHCCMQFLVDCKMQYDVSQACEPLYQLKTLRSLSRLSSRHRSPPCRASTNQSSDANSADAPFVPSLP